MESGNWSIRALRESDLSEWLRLRKLLWDETPEDDHRDEMVDIIEHPDSQCVIVAESSEGSLIGFLEVSIRPFVEDCETDHVGYLEGWFVANDHRRKGIGAELVRHAEDWAKQKGCTEIASDAEVGNEVSLNVHTALGYDVTSRLVHLRKVLN
jgi:aminoglycoside 6'-N-acetyltransferase I